MSATRNERKSRPLPELIADKIREKGHTQIEAADKLGVSGPAVSRWIAGKTYPEDRNYKGIANYLGISVAELSAIVHEDKMDDEARGLGPQVAELREQVRDSYEARRVPRETTRVDRFGCRRRP